MIGISELQIPQTVVFGCGTASRVGLEVKSLKKRKVLIVTDRTMIEIGNIKVIQEALDREGIKYEIFDKVLQEPILEYIELGLDFFKNTKCEALIALGGGSPIDTAKAISVMVNNTGSITDYLGLNKVKERGVPLIAIPTTAGTGSEMSRYSILTDAKNNIKYFSGSLHFIPTAALVDPMMTLSMPKSLTAFTGLDALCHAIEGYISVKANPVSDMFCLSAINLISHNLRQAWADGRNVVARTNTMLGAMYAGVSLNVSSVTLVHGMARPIGANFHIPHGLANAMLLSTVMEFSWIGNPVRYAQIAEAMGEKVSSLNEKEAAQKSVNAVKSLIEDLNVPNLSEAGVKQEELSKVSLQMAKDAIASGSPMNNPRQATIEEIIKLYDKAFLRHDGVKQERYMELPV